MASSASSYDSPHFKYKKIGSDSQGFDSSLSLSVIKSENEPFCLFNYKEHEQMLLRETCGGRVV